ncbi:MAG: hypothetical protein GY808_11595 [Gammaproteobacteria bacterium]|nr:hypothetical protein [Gammaproteobacteria bacterium]
MIGSRKTNQISNIIRKRCCLFLTFSWLFGCHSTETTQEELTAKPDLVQKPQQISDYMIATVKHIPLEGGFYGLITEDNQKLLASNLDKKYFSEGTILRFRLQAVEGVMTIQQWGKAVKISDVTLIKKGIERDK